MAHSVGDNEVKRFMAKRSVQWADALRKAYDGTIDATAGRRERKEREADTTLNRRRHYRVGEHDVSLLLDVDQGPPPSGTTSFVLLAVEDQAGTVTVGRVVDMATRKPFVMPASADPDLPFDSSPPMPGGPDGVPIETVDGRLVVGRPLFVDWERMNAQDRLPARAPEVFFPLSPVVYVDEAGYGRFVDRVLDARLRLDAAVSTFLNRGGPIAGIAGIDVSGPGFVAVEAITADGRFVRGYRAIFDESTAGLRWLTPDDVSGEGAVLRSPETIIEETTRAQVDVVAARQAAYPGRLVTEARLPHWNAGDPDYNTLVALFEQEYAELGKGGLARSFDRHAAERSGPAYVPPAARPDGDVATRTDHVGPPPPPPPAARRAQGESGRKGPTVTSVPPPPPPPPPPSAQSAKRTEIGTQLGRVAARLGERDLSSLLGVPLATIQSRSAETVSAPGRPPRPLAQVVSQALTDIEHALDRAGKRGAPMLRRPELSHIAEARAALVGRSDAAGLDSPDSTSISGQLHSLLVDNGGGLDADAGRNTID